uniref:ATP synthase complex subunit 8 n=1 Tax=Glaucidium brasilianum TaxID=78217 RepID=A0A7L8DCQ3_GLABR|nr:ATP synthase F0 subunit 8 [Glaucidium brasilianum]
MPQLNPSPWLLIMLVSWYTFTIMMQPKISSFTLTALPSNKPLTTTNTTPWTWPWT